MNCSLSCIGVVYRQAVKYTSTSIAIQRCNLETLVLVSRCIEEMKNGLGLGLEIKVLVLILAFKKRLDLSLGLDEKVSMFSRP